MDIRQVHFEINDLINDQNRLKNNNAGAVLYSVLNFKKNVVCKHGRQNLIF